MIFWEKSDKLLTIIYLFAFFLLNFNTKNERSKCPAEEKEKDTKLPLINAKNGVKETDTKKSSVSFSITVFKKGLCALF